MSAKKKTGSNAQVLRRRSSDFFTEGDTRAPENQSILTPESARRILNELHLNQTQLEVLNEELLRNQAALEKSQARYFDFYNLAPVGYLTFNSKALIVEANLTIATMLGVDLKSLVGQTLTHFILPEDQDNFYLYCKQLFSTGKSRACELRLLKKGSEPFWVQFEAALVSDAADVTLGQAVLSDITELKQTEEALQESETKYHQLFALGSDALFLIDNKSGKILDANLAAVSLYGYSYDELTGLRNVDLSAEPDETQKATAHTTVCAETSLAVTIPLRYHRRKDGTVFPVEINAASLLWKGRPAHIPAIRDITERKHTEEVIRASQERYRAVVEQSTEALTLVNLETEEVVEVNHRFTEMLGYSLPKDSPLYMRSFSVDTEANLNATVDFLLKQRFLPTEARIFRHKDGTEVPVERSARLIKIDGRDYLLASMRDMTAERRRQAEMIRDVEFARRVQRGLLPKPADSPLVSICTLYHPSRFVSGDSYFLEWCNEGKLLRGFIFDVSGHDLATALQTASVSVLLREALMFQLPMLSQMQQVNSRLEKYFTEGAYAAILGFELDLSLRELRYVGAGITQFYTNGKKIETPGMFVGMWDDAEFVAGTLPITPGDCFHFLTDGYADWLAHPENAGFWSNGGKDFDTDVMALEELADSGMLRDDATAVCLNIKGVL